MSSSELLDKASDLSYDAHKGQRYGNHDYWTRHICMVELKARELYGLDYEVLVVAQLHDILEDTTVTQQELQEIFGDVLTEAVIAITKLEGESRNKYIERVKQNKIAYKVKLCDTICNLEESIKIQDAKRIIKYSEQLVKLYKNKEKE